ncbi:MAG: hypothetical protein R3286_19375 [Gammaproteobacteria bacterium]|nr:hypothetical protein [Gammaproteobacteria bacterium]
MEESAHIVHFNAAGNLVTASLFLAFPVLVVAGAVWARRKGGGEERWTRLRQYWYLPALVPIVLYYGVVYRWLFHDQFYWITVKRDGEWQLEYCIPPVTRTIAAADIWDIRGAEQDIWTYRSARIVIVTSDGEEFPSAQVSALDEDYYVDLLMKFRSAP